MVPFTYNRVSGARAASACDQVATTFETFVEGLSEPKIRERKDGAAIVLATFGDRPNSSGNLRWDGNVTAITGFALDLDAGATEEDIRARLTGYMYAAHTTYSHSTKQGKWRVILPFSEPADPALAHAVFEHFNELFDGRLDAACKNPSRLYYLPACPKDRRPLYRWFWESGTPFDPVASLNPGKASASPRRLEIVTALQGVKEGERDDNLFRLACKLRASGVPREQAEELVQAAAAECSPPFDPDEAHKKVASAWRYAANSMMTDLANSQRLVRKHAGRIRHAFKFRRWMFWDGTRWRIDEDGHVLRLARQTVMSIYSELLSNPEHAQELLKHAKASQQAARLEAMERLARTEEGVPVAPDQLDANPWLLGTPQVSRTAQISPVV